LSVQHGVFDVPVAEGLHKVEDILRLVVFHCGFTVL